MKYKGIYSLILCIIIGGLMSKYILDQYDNKKLVQKSSNDKEIVYFLKQGSYSTKEEMENNMNNISYYIYSIEAEKYNTYVGMTSKKENIEKLKKHFNNIGYSIEAKEIEVTDKQFLETLQQYDLMLENTEDTNTISAICSQVLAKYEELVINDEN